LGVPLVLDRHGRANDELDDLAVSIDRLTNDLSLAFSRQQIVEDHLKQQSRNLEKAVAARTSSLEIANNQLKQEIEQRKTMEQERERLIADLQKALGDVKQLSGLLPICSHCKKIRDDSGYWNQIESYIREHSGVEFSHGICQDCLKKYYPDYDQ
jgi:hypothetical protein